MRLIISLLALATTALAAPKPNIIFFLADDLGYNEVGCYGQKKIHTPNLDQMAKDGVRFTQFYSGHAVCAASRCSFLTGKHTGHSFVRENSEGKDKAAKDRIKQEDGHWAQLALPARETTVATMLKGAGYRTACIGKWGLGHPSNEGSPNKHGFDLFYGFISQWQAHDHYPTYLWRNDVKEPLPGNDGVSLHGKHYAHDVMEKEALDFISSSRDKPFFLYFGTPIPHVSLQVPEDEPSLAGYRRDFAGQDPPYDGKMGYHSTDDPRAIYAAMVTRMDRTLGKLREALQKSGQADNTLIIFTSDNGATFNGGYDRDFFEGNKPLHGMKTQLWDGGIRVPCIAAWPGKIKAGLVSDLIGANWDLLPTFAELAEAKVPAAIDGASIVPTLVGGQQSPREHLYWETVAGGVQAVRMGQWKAIRQGAAKKADAPIQFFNIRDDIGETKDVASEHPEVVQKIIELMRSSHTPSEYFPLGAQDSGKSSATTIPLRGNSYATQGKVDRRPDRFILADPSTVLSAFVHADRPAQVQLALTARVAEGASTVKATVNGKTFTAAFKAKPTKQTLPLGMVDIAAAGYFRVDLQGATEMIDLVCTSATPDLTFSYVKDNEDNRFYWGRRGPSVHLSYPAPKGQMTEYFYNEVTVPKGDDPIGSYYMANGFSEGYFGMQVNSATERRILFSIWSPFKTDDPKSIPEAQRIKLLAKGDGVRVGEFGNEGSGGQSFFIYPWQAGQTYRFLNRARPDGNGSTIYTAWFYIAEKQTWQLIASFQRPQTNKHLTGLHSFLENFSDEQGWITRSARYGNQWTRDTEGHWHRLTTARFTADDIGNCGYRLDYTGGAEGSSFFLRNGGFFFQPVKIGSSFERLAESDTEPQIDFRKLDHQLEH
jgi:arylsulfatase A